MTKSQNSPHSAIIAKEFAGASMLKAIRYPFGEKNIIIARRILAENNFRIIAEGIEGTRSGSAHFNTRSGKVTVRYQ